MIRVLLVDDHPALRAGLAAVLRTEPDIEAVGTASSPEDLWPQFNRTRPDLVVLDYHLPGTDGLVLCRRLKCEIPTPAVLVYSAYADASLTVPAVLAGADGLLHKGVPAQVLTHAIRSIARGERVLPALRPELQAAAADKLDVEDQPILGMRVAGTAHHEIAETLRLAPADLLRRVDAMIERLGVDVPTAARPAI
jgi:DNA-binding NarL/FixJ family response regulator